MSFVDRVLQTGLNPPEALKEQTLPPDLSADPATIFKPAKHKVCMLFTSRSGTTFFVDILNRTQQFGTIREHMNPYMVRRGVQRWDVTSMSQYLQRTVRRSTTANGVFGFKGTVEALLPLIQVGEIPDNADDWHWITVRRRDTIAQAVSLFRAKTTGVWHQKADGGAEPGEAEAPPVPKYDYSGIAKQVTLIQRKQGQIERFFAHLGLEPLRLVYEDFCDDPTDALEAVFKHVGLTPAENLDALVAESTFEVLRNTATEEYVERFRTELGRKLST